MSLFQFCVNNSRNRWNNSHEKSYKYLGENISQDFNEVKYISKTKDIIFVPKVISCHWTQFPAPTESMLLIFSIIYGLVALIGLSGNGLIIFIWWR